MPVVRHDRAARRCDGRRKNGAEAQPALAGTGAARAGGTGAARAGGTGAAPGGTGVATQFTRGRGAPSGTTRRRFGLDAGRHPARPRRTGSGGRLRSAMEPAPHGSRGRRPERNARAAAAMRRDSVALALLWCLRSKREPRTPVKTQALPNPSPKPVLAKADERRPGSGRATARTPAGALIFSYALTLQDVKFVQRKADRPCC
jgi:hypothetical protein